MQADRFRLNMRPFAAQAAHPIVLHHFQRLRQRLLFALNQRARLATRHQAAVGLIAAIGEDFLARRQLIMLSGADKLAARQPNQHQVGVGIAHRTGDIPPGKRGAQASGEISA